MFLIWKCYARARGQGHGSVRLRQFDSGELSPVSSNDYSVMLLRMRCSTVSGSSRMP